MSPPIPFEPQSLNDLAEAPIAQKAPPPATTPPTSDSSRKVVPPIHATDPNTRLAAGLPRRPSATEWVPKPPRPLSPGRSPSPRSPRTPPRPNKRRSRSPSRSPSPTSPASWSPSPPRGGRKRFDHYSPRERWSPEPDYLYRREASPQPYMPRKRARGNDSWVPSDNPRTGNTSKRRVVAPRSPASPRRRSQTQDQSLPPSKAPFSSTSAATYGARRRNMTGPPKHPSKWPESLSAPQRAKPNSANHAPEATLLHRISINRSPGQKANRRGYVPLEERLTQPT